MSVHIPIFIIVHDRITVLKESIESYRQIAQDVQIVLHDVASTYQPCLEYLDEERANGTPVYRSEVNNHLSVMDTVESYLKEHPMCKYYVITDPDIALDNVNANIMDFYIYLLEKFNRIVGPMLRIDDIPDYYPKKEAVIQRHTSQFWGHTPSEVKYEGDKFKILLCPIDTTFQLRKSTDLSRKFPRRDGIRCYSPYAAKHLDWYINPNDMAEDQRYYSEHASRVAHWGRKINDKSPFA